MMAPDETPLLERQLAALLQAGTWAASGIIAAGLLLQSLGWRAPLDLVGVGIVSFILLPVLRVLVMCGSYLQDRDTRMAAIAATVLGLMLVGFLVGVVVT